MGIKSLQPVSLENGFEEFRIWSSTELTSRPIRYQAWICFSVKSNRDFFLKAMNETLCTEPSAWSPEPVFSWRPHTSATEAFSSLTPRAGVHIRVTALQSPELSLSSTCFTLDFQKGAEQGIFSVPCTDWCFPGGLVCSVCLEGQG